MAMGIIRFILLGSLYLFSAFILYKTSPVLSSLILMVGFVHLVYRGIRPALARRRLVRKTRKAVSGLIREHIPTLARKRATLVKKDDYGIVHYDEWEREKDYFIDVVLRERFSAILTEDFPLSPDRVDDLIETAVDAFVQDLYVDMSVAESAEDAWVEGGEHSYREYCLKLLELSGWKVLPETPKVRPESPILAERDGTRMVVTCVNATSPVGGRMIRRASAARKKLGAHTAAVVTNGEYSRWARMVSSRCRVMPLHHEDLANI